MITIDKGYSKKHIEFILSLNLQYDFLNNINEELLLNKVSWLFFEQNNIVIGAHRSIIHQNSVEFSGLFINTRIPDPILYFKILKVVVNYYKDNKYNYIYAYVDDDLKEKEFVLKKLKFVTKEEVYNRYIFNQKDLVRDISLDLDNYYSIKNLLFIKINKNNKIKSRLLREVINKDITRISIDVNKEDRINNLRLLFIPNIIILKKIRIMELKFDK